MQALVGKIVQTGQFESMVMPLYDTSSGVSARLAESRYEGIVEGQGADIPPRMRYIRKRARDDISVGELIVTSGMGGVYPAGINLGRVSGILYQEDETSMEVELESSADFSRLEYVFVIDAQTNVGVDVQTGNDQGLQEGLVDG
jgi:rod shape-determining protein MreC